MDNVLTPAYSEEELRELFGANLPELEKPEEALEPIPESMLTSGTTARFSSAVWFEDMKNLQITLAGLGGIGSYVAFLLSRLRPNFIYMYDGDTVEETNMSGQMFERANVGLYKAHCIAHMMGNFSDYRNVVSFNSMFTPDSDIQDITICGFDNMEARALFFNKWKERVKRVPEEDRRDLLFIDGRLAAEEFQVFCMTGEDQYLMKKYASEWLFPDIEAEQTICSYKQTSFCATMIASVMVNLLVNFVANKQNIPFKRDLPFLTRYDAATMALKTELP